MSAFTFWIVDDAEVLRRFQNPFELQAGVFLRMVTLVGFECLAVRLQKNIMDSSTGLNRSNENKSPRLHQAHRGCVMGGLQESTQDLVTQWFGQEARSHIAPVTQLPEILRHVASPGLRPSRTGVLIIAHFGFDASVKFQQPSEEPQNV